MKKTKESDLAKYKASLIKAKSKYVIEAWRYKQKINRKKREQEQNKATPAPIINPTITY